MEGSHLAKRLIGGWHIRLKACRMDSAINVFRNESQAIPGDNAIYVENAREFCE